MSDEDWNGQGIHTIGLRMAGNAPDLRDEEGHHTIDDTLVILMNASAEPVEFRLPLTQGNERWSVVLDTSRPYEAANVRHYRGRTRYQLEARALVVLAHPTSA